jgi:sedoheptulokinase
MTEELYDMYLLMNEKRAGVVGSGNGIRKNKALCRVVEKVFGAKLRVPVYTEEAACGAALFALVASGTFKGVSEAKALIRYTER